MAITDPYKLTNKTDKPAFDLGTAYENNNKMKYRQQGIDALKPVEPFKTDLASIQSDPTYQAAMDSARQATQVAEGDISSALNRRGIMDSSITANAASNAAQQEYGRVNRELLPKLIEDQYKRYIDQNNMNRQYASDLFGVSDMYANDDQTAFNNSITESGVTGQYIPSGAQPIMERLNTLKSSTEAMWSQLTPEQRAEATSQADGLRSQLQAMGIDPALFGADVTAQQSLANVGKAGIRTVQAQGQDFNQGLARDQFDRGVLESDRGFNEDTRRYNQEFEYTQGRDAVKDQQWQQEFDRILKQDGIQEALAWAQNSISQQNANTSAGNLALSRDEFKYRQEQDKLESKAGTAADLTAKDSANNLNQFKSNIQGLSYQDALMYLQNPAVSSLLTDADYKKAIELLEENEGLND